MGQVHENFKVQTKSQIIWFFNEIQDEKDGLFKNPPSRNERTTSAR